ncbi:CMRF35-like molecule 9 [Ctenodactylus gundi]
MRPLVLLWGCLVLPGYEAMKGPKEISGFEGDTVTLQCTYGKELRERRKYWCREAGFVITRCSGTIYAGQNGQETTEGRFSIRDSPQELTFKVTLRDLTLKDAGKYWCGADRLGPDEAFLISLTVFPGKEKSTRTTGACCPPSPTLSFQPLATRSLQPKAKVWQTQPPELTSPDLRPTVTTAKQRESRAEAPWRRPAEASPSTGASPYAGSSPYPATSPPAGSSRPAVLLDSSVTESASPVSSSRSSSRARGSIPMSRLMAPFLVLLSLLLATSLITLGSHILQQRKRAPQAAETQWTEKVYLQVPPPGNSCTPGDTVIHLDGPTRPLASLPAGSDTKIQCLSQTTEEEGPSQALEVSTILVPSLPASEEEPDFTKFISV